MTVGNQTVATSRQVTQSSSAGLQLAQQVFPWVSQNYPDKPRAGRPGSSGPGLPSRHERIPIHRRQRCGTPKPLRLRSDGYYGRVSDAAHHYDEGAHGTALLPRDLTDEQLSKAPVLVSVDTLLIEELSEAEDDAFSAALSS